MLEKNLQTTAFPLTSEWRCKNLGRLVLSLAAHGVPLGAPLGPPTTRHTCT